MKNGFVTSILQTLIVFFVMCVLCFGFVAALTPAPVVADDDVIEVESGRTPNSTLTVDVTNAAEMHKLGLPTKTDVMSFHVYGHWGYVYADEDDERVFKVFYELPGGTDVWDKLYGIEVGHEAE